MNRLMLLIVVTYLAVVATIYGKIAVSAYQESGWVPGGLFALCAVVVVLGGFMICKEWEW